MTKKFTALDVCRILRSHLAFSSDCVGTLDTMPFNPTSQHTVKDLLDGVIDGNGKFTIESNAKVKIASSQKLR